MKEALRGSRRLVLCGASTDCCVLGTAFAAIDEASKYGMVTDACAADPVLHEHDLAILARREPHVVLSVTDDEIQRLYQVTTNWRRLTWPRWLFPPRKCS